MVQIEDKAKVRGEKAKEAITLAVEGRWEEAARVNQEILRLFPQEVEALNRLGKALMEMGDYGRAQEAFQQALSVSPHNIIAKKNLGRLARLQEQAPQSKSARRVMPQRFIAESGRSGVTVLHRAAPREVLTRIAPGEVVQLQIEDHALTVRSLQGEYLGQVEPKLAFRLIRLMRGGNRYEGAVVSAKGEEMAVLLVEVHRDPGQAGISSFPASDGDHYRAYSRGAMLQYDQEDEGEGDEADTVVEWREELGDSFGIVESVGELEPI